MLLWKIPVNHTGLDFCATFMNINELNSFAQSHPDNVRLETVSTLEKILKDLKHLKQTQSIFVAVHGSKLEIGK
jgi:hypothetical protein